MVVRLGLLLSALAALVVAGWSVWALIVAFEWRLVIVVYAAFYVLVALAVIWLAVLVAVVVARAVRLARHEQ